MSSCCVGKNSSDNRTLAEATTGEELTAQQIREGVRQHYSEIAVKATAINGADGGSCCSGSGSDPANSCYAPSADPAYATKLGYTAEDLKLVPDGANLGLGCGNPVIFAKLKSGETVVDLGSGAGFDAFIAGRAVGPTGHVIGVDMTPEMVSKARRNAERNGSKHVEFRLGEIEHLPIADGSVDVIISNCVINLVPEECKHLVFNDCSRVLKSGGRLCISDVVTSVVLPPVVREELKNYAGCLNGATLLSKLESYLEEAGFKEITITPKDESKEFIKTWAPNHKVTDLIVSALIEATKP